MAKSKRKAIAAATRGKATLHGPAPDTPDHDRSIVLAVKALSSSSFPPLASAVCSSVLEPILEAAPGPASLNDITVDDCSEDAALAGDLLDEEQLDFSFTDDDCEDLLPSPPLFPPPAGLVPTPLSGGSPPPTTAVAGSSPPSGGKVWTDLFSTRSRLLHVQSFKTSPSIILLRPVPFLPRTSSLSLKSGTCVQSVMSLAKGQATGL